MDDEPDVGLVYAHAEGDGGDDDRRVAAEEALLGFAPYVILQPCVVGQRAEALLGEPGGQVLSALAGEAVDDGRALATLAQQPGQHVEAPALGQDPVGEVGPVEAGDELRGFGDSELVDDVAPHSLGRGGSQSYHRD